LQKKGETWVTVMSGVRVLESVEWRGISEKKGLNNKKNGGGGKKRVIYIEESKRIP